jgi:Homeodomain-like domain
MERISLDRITSGLMLRVDYERWDQPPADLRHMALNATHNRTRERLLALHDIAQGACATQVAERTGRRPQTVMDWLHSYNDHGPEALSYRRTGGRPPFAQRSKPRLATKSVPPGRPQPHHP